LALRLSIAWHCAPSYSSRSPTNPPVLTPSASRRASCRLSALPTNPPTSQPRHISLRSQHLGYSACFRSQGSLRARPTRWRDVIERCDNREPDLSPFLTNAEIAINPTGTSAGHNTQWPAHGMWAAPLLLEIAEIGKLMIMQLFRILADLSHISAKCILIFSIHRNRSAEG